MDSNQKYIIPKINHWEIQYFIPLIITCSLSLSTGESEGYTVATKEKDIAISDYPLLQTEFLYASKKGTAD